MIKNGLRFLFFAAFAAFANPAHAVFVGDIDGKLYDLDVGTNMANEIGMMSVPMLDIAQNPITGDLYGVAFNPQASFYSTIYSINPTTAASTLIGDTGILLLGVNGLTFDAAGILYGSGGNMLLTINTGTGTATSVGNTGFNSSGDLAFDSSGNLFMSATGGGGGGDQLVSLNSTTGAGSSIGDIGFNGVLGLNFVGAILYGFTDDEETITIDTDTGAGSFVVKNNIKAFGADGVAVVPIPAALPLMATALAGLGIFGWRRRPTS